jgi:WD40 repeat protein
MRALWALAFDPNGDELVVLESDWTVRGRDPQTGRVVHTYSSIDKVPLRGLQFSPDGKLLFVQQESDEALIVRRSNDVVEARFPNPVRQRVGIFRTALGDMWIEIPMTHSILLRKDMSGPEVLKLAGPTNLVCALGLSRDGRMLAAGGEDQVIYCWDLARPANPMKLIGHEGPVVDLCFSPDGGTILSRGGDGTVRFWHVATGAELLKLGTPEEPIVCMGLSPTANLLVLGVEHGGRWGLQLHRLGPGRDSLPKTFAGLPGDQP